jgi:hypothetical protein
MVVPDLNEFLIAYNEAIPGHLEDMYLLADQAGELTSCLPLAFVLGRQCLGLDGGSQATLTEAVPTEENTWQVTRLFKARGTYCTMVQVSMDEFKQLL